MADRKEYKHRDTYQYIEVSSLSDYIHAIDEISEKVGHDLYFRGENGPYDYMLPSLDREPRVSERIHEYYGQLTLDSTKELRSEETPFDKLTHFQHYSAKTRLLDITENALTGLFFALDGASNRINANREKPDQDPETVDESVYVYVFDAGKNNANVETPGGVTEQIKAGIQFMPKSEVDEFIEQMSNPYSPVTLYLNAVENDHTVSDISETIFYDFYVSFYKSAQRKIDQAISERLQEYTGNGGLDLLNHEWFKNKTVDKLIDFLSDEQYKWGDPDKMEKYSFITQLQNAIEQIAEPLDDEKGSEKIKETINSIRDMSKIINASNHFLNSLEKIVPANVMKDVNPITIVNILNNAQIFRAKKNNDRIVQQLGLFIMPAYPFVADRSVTIDIPRLKENVAVYERTAIQFSLEKLMVRGQVNKSMHDNYNYIESIQSKATRNKKVITSDKDKYEAMNALHKDPDSTFTDKKPIAIKITGVEKVKKMIKQLASLGVHSGTMYPDIQHRSEYLVEKYRQDNQF